MQAVMNARKPRNQAISGHFRAGRTYRGRIKDDVKIDAEYVDGEIMQRSKEELKQKYNYWQGTGKDKRWKVHYYVGSKRCDKKCATEQEMIRFLISLEAGEEKTVKHRLTFGECVTQWREIKDLSIDDNSADKYNSEYRRHIQGTEFEKKPIREITKDDIIRFMIDKILHPTRRGKLSEHPLCLRSAKQLWYIIRDVFEWAEDHDIIDEDITLNIKPTKAFLHLSQEHERLPERVVISEQDNRLLNQQYREDHQKNPEYLPTYAVELVGLTAMRPGEAVALKMVRYRHSSGAGKTFQSLP